ncbi:hypothetical protein I314_02030 [Cryptococcus bacillisporus CA1873]|uniref:HAMP domain-containing protein n=1 Tax=Cryptococcus bacillisporus CA1873 TaxID=1296111 RepID=A0ABR5BFK4_CRYGA|nr:hypothetical protein I314_02030 [Cryptococcus bacillisporus CA1873]|eukprot:KIR67613.1 hypothetical protein I314_02030 [Cryptococcus gattii CA1873]
MSASKTNSSLSRLGSIRSAKYQSTGSVGELGETLDKMVDRLNKQVDEKSAELLKQMDEMANRIESLGNCIDALAHEPIDRSTSTSDQ